MNDNILSDAEHVCRDEPPTGCLRAVEDIGGWQIYDDHGQIAGPFAGPIEAAGEIARLRTLRDIGARSTAT